LKQLFVVGFYVQALIFYCQQNKFRLGNPEADARAHSSSATGTSGQGGCKIEIWKTYL
jgi:hypothetical protein